MSGGLIPMKALVMREYKKLSYEEVPTPQPGEGEVLVRLKAAASPP